MVREYLVVHNNNMDLEKGEQPEEMNGTPEEAHGQNQIVALTHPPTPTPTPTQTTGTSAFTPYPRNQQYSHSPQYIHHLQQQELHNKLNEFWTKQYQEIEDTVEIKTHCLPLARIKKIMKADEGVKMISAEAPMLFAKACEIFIMELTMRSWVNADVNKRRTLQKSDIASAISRTDMFDFLVDTVPKEDTMEHEALMSIPRRGTAVIGNVPYYYVPMPMPVPVPPQHAAGPSYAPPPSMFMGRPLSDQPYYRQLPALHPYATQVLPIPKQQNHSPDSTEETESDD